MHLLGISDRISRSSQLLAHVVRSSQHVRSCIDKRLTDQDLRNSSHSSREQILGRLNAAALLGHLQLEGVHLCGRTRRKKRTTPASNVDLSAQGLFSKAIGNRNKESQSQGRGKGQ